MICFICGPALMTLLSIDNGIPCGTYSKFSFQFRYSFFSSLGAEQTAFCVRNRRRDADGLKNARKNAYAAVALCLCVFVCACVCMFRNIQVLFCCLRMCMMLKHLVVETDVLLLYAPHM